MWNMDFFVGVIVFVVCIVMMWGSLSMFYFEYFFVCFLWFISFRVFFIGGVIEENDYYMVCF